MHQNIYFYCLSLGENVKPDKFIHDRDMAWLDESDGKAIAVFDNFTVV